MRQPHITLFIPGLLGGTALREGRYFEGLAVAELELLLTRARRRHHPPRPPESSLFALFGHAAVNPPVAAVTHVADRGVLCDRFVLRADPVHLQPDRDRVVMIGNRHLAVTPMEAQQLVAEFNRLCAADGLRLEAPAPERWYLLADDAPRIRTHSLHEVVGQDIHPYLPAGSDAMYWHRLLNEVQMLFYASPVNEARRRHGLPEINSVWLWGEGDPPRLEASWRRIWSNDTLSTALARLSGGETATLPASGEEWLEQVDAAGSHLVVIDAVADALNAQDLQRWRDMVEAVDEAWLAPLIGALRGGRLAGIRLLSDTAEFELDARGLKRWWRRRRSLAQLRPGA